MTIFKRNAALAALVAFAGACGGGQPQTEGTEPVTTESPAENAAPAAPAAETPAPATAGGTVHEVRMVTTQNGAAGVFEPANLTVKKGDVIHFVNVQAGVAHNADFNTPENSGKPGLPGATQFLTAAGQSEDVTVTMDPGTYTFQCTPHAMMGMKGTLTVQ
jgi:plastocyanin